jgi:hypothetical protein
MIRFVHPEEEICDKSREEQRGAEQLKNKRAAQARKKDRQTFFFLWSLTTFQESL